MTPAHEHTYAQAQAHLYTLGEETMTPCFKYPLRQASKLCICVRYFQGTLVSERSSASGYVIIIISWQRSRHLVAVTIVTTTLNSFIFDTMNVGWYQRLNVEILVHIRMFVFVVISLVCSRKKKSKFHQIRFGL